MSILRLVIVISLYLCFAAAITLLLCGMFKLQKRNEAMYATTHKWENAYGIDSSVLDDDVEFIMAKCGSCGKWAFHLMTEDEKMHYNYCPRCGERLSNGDRCDKHVAFTKKDGVRK